MFKDFQPRCCLWLTLVLMNFIVTHAQFGILPQINVNANNIPLSLLQPQSTHPPPLPQHGPPVLAKNITSPELVRESSLRISRGAKQFSMDLYAKISDVIHLNKAHKDFMISPFAVWSLLLVLTEGAEGSTLSELRRGLHLDAELPEIRQAYRSVQRFLNYTSPAVEVATLQAVFINKNTPLTRAYENVIERDYAATIMGVEFNNPVQAAQEINQLVETVTRGLLPYTVLPQNLKDVELFLMSALFFRGQWKNPFNASLTRSEPFYDENDTPIGDVRMMVQEGNFRYATMNELEGHVLELPYGMQNRLSMFVIMPRKGISINKVAHNLKNIDILQIYEKLDAVSQGYEDDLVEVLMPKFTTETHFALESILSELGIDEVFQPSAQLNKITNNVFVQTLFHSTKIIVNEEGTRAAAVAGATLVNKSTPTKFHLNRPFIYMIVEKTTGLMLFIGEVMNPNSYVYPV